MCVCRTNGCRAPDVVSESDFYLASCLDWMGVLKYGMRSQFVSIKCYYILYISQVTGLKRIDQCARMRIAITKRLAFNVLQYIAQSIYYTMYISLLERNTCKCMCNNVKSTFGSIQYQTLARMLNTNPLHKQLGPTECPYVIDTEHVSLARSGMECISNVLT